jgi:hypothetical protein
MQRIHVISQLQIMEAKYQFASRPRPMIVRSIPTARSIKK